jgi:hypothetical protein
MKSEIGRRKTGSWYRRTENVTVNKSVWKQIVRLKSIVAQIEHCNIAMITYSNRLNM